MDVNSQSDSMEKIVEDWTTQDVADWLERNGFEKYITLFCDEHEIDGKALLTLTEADLRNPPLELKVLGDIKRLLILILQLQKANQYSVRNLLHGVDGCVQNTVQNFQYPNLRRRRHRRESSDSTDFMVGGDSSFEDDTSHNGYKELRPEVWKTVVGMFYFLSVTWITAIVMVIVHDRVPDMQTYPPLPDIFLDNVPLIPWAFAMCEWTGLILFLIWASILIFHRHRFILMRRMFALFGSVFLLRCITMIITSLSVPGKHLECKARGGGMSIKGVRTCGDYMFSGHTVVLTLLNFFITEYTPLTMYYLHTFTWVLNLFGIFFILAAHEHYSIDVFIAFYISTRLFLYYHTLANNRALMQDDRKRTRIWFPLFYFFESGVDGIVPNEYEWPLKFPHCIRAMFSRGKTS